MQRKMHAPVAKIFCDLPFNPSDPISYSTHGTHRFDFVEEEIASTQDGSPKLPFDFFTQDLTSLKSDLRVAELAHEAPLLELNSLAHIPTDLTPRRMLSAEVDSLQDLFEEIPCNSEESVILEESFPLNFAPEEKIYLTDRSEQ